MTTVTEDLDLPSGTDPTGVIVTVYLAGENGQQLSEAYNSSTEKTIVGQHRLAPAADGTWSLDLAPNADLVPAGTVWARQVSTAQPSGASTVTVPSSGGPVRWDEILADPPGTLASSALSTHEADETAHGTVESDSTTIVHSVGSSPVITQTPLQVSPIPDLVVTVPDLPDPVFLYGKAIVDPLAPLPDTLADVEADQDGMQLSIAAASTDPIGLDTVLDSSHAPVMWNGSGIVCMVELDPHSAGDYQLFATRTNGDLRILTPDHARARIGWFRTRPPFA